MGKRNDNRLRNLRKLIAQFSSQSALAAAIGKEQSYISRISTGSRGMGDEVADHIEQALGLPYLWLDQSDDADVPLAAAGKESRALAEIVDKLNKQQRVILLAKAEEWAKQAKDKK
jgi:transcriptional regulator with XRE-family HTH domain